jgi:hypothetical protein
MLPMLPTTVIGVDCATVASKVGLARAHADAGRWRVADARTYSPAEPPAALLTQWITETPHALLALDAPLGWPEALGRSLAGHAAGEAIGASADVLFTRATDHAIYRRTGKRPLEVGADRIARTALATLALIDTVRKATGLALPVAWRTSDPLPCAIEVYPAATLHQHGLPSRSYKERGAPPRAVIGAWLRGRLDIPETLDLQSADEHLFDALVCVLAGIDFISGEAVAPAPHEAEVARREGWIWVR